MSSEESHDQVEKKQLRGTRAIHLPSVDPDCYVAVHNLELGKYKECLRELSRPQNWGDLRQILQLVADLVVKDALGQCFVDDVRRQFDSVMISYAVEKGQFPFINDMMWQNRQDPSGGFEILRMLLAVGLNPDLPDTIVKMRPSHSCGILARADLASLIFPCRPSMTAVAFDLMTPLQAASRNEKILDNELPQRRFLRKDVRDYIQNGGFETRFPSLAELAIRGSWFAVKNLLRRRVVAPAEFGELLEGKTAAEWADFYQKPGIAEEIRYYAADPSTRLELTCKHIAAMAGVLCDKIDEAYLLTKENAELKEQMDKLSSEAAVKDAKIEELAEALALVRTRLEDA